RQIILRNLRNPALSADSGAVLKTIASQCDALESCWGEVEACCGVLPTTLVHGDFRRKNVRVRTDRTGTALLPVDWETAGWGAPAADLAWPRGLGAQVDLPTYCSVAREHWPGLDVRTLERLANVGTIFQRLAAVHWDCWAVASRWAEKVIGSMRTYQAEMAYTLQALGWSG